MMTRTAALALPATGSGAGAGGRVQPTSAINIPAATRPKSFRFIGTILMRSRAFGGERALQLRLRRLQFRARLRVLALGRERLVALEVGLNAGQGGAAHVRRPWRRDGR